MNRLNTLLKRLVIWGLKEPLLLLAAVLAMAAFGAFGEVLEDVLEGESHAMDAKILLALRDAGNIDSPYGPRWLEEAMRDITGLGGTAVLVLITSFAISYLFARRKKLQACYLLAAVTTGVILSNLLKYGFDRPRPDLVPHGSYTMTASFPSGHSLISAVVYLTLGAILAETQESRRMKIFILFAAATVTLLVGISRVYLGVHWPSDVLAGWLVGAGWALSFWVIARYILLHFEAKAAKQV